MVGGRNEKFSFCNEIETIHSKSTSNAISTKILVFSDKHSTSNSVRYC